MGDLSNDVAAIHAAIDLFYERMLAEPSIAPLFAGADMRALRRHQRAFIHQAIGGASVYAGRDMRAAHTGLAISDAQFDLACDLLGSSLRDSGVGVDVVARAMTDIERLRGLIVQRRG